MLTAAAPSSDQSGNSVIAPCTNSCKRAAKSGHLPEDYEIQELLTAYRKGLKIMYSVMYNKASEGPIH
jgi:hypothetical protein